MLSEFFYWVLNISILGSLTGLVILIAGKIKSLPRFAVYLLWILPLIRLWIPFGVSSHYSLLSLISKFATKTVVVWGAAPASGTEAFVGAEITASNFVQAAGSYFPIVYKTNLLESIFHVASIVWIVIAVAALIAAVLIYALTKSELKSAENIKGNIFKSDKITAPAVYGIFKPKIIIPESLMGGNTDYIMMHEQVHIRRKDNFWRAVAVITACVHWFNPLVWIFLKRFFADMELACDAKVVSLLDKSGKKEYASAVLSATSGKVFFASAFGGAKTKVRIENILSYKKLTVFSGICFTTLVIAVAIVLITNATG